MSFRSRRIFIIFFVIIITTIYILFLTQILQNSSKISLLNNLFDKNENHHDTSETREQFSFLPTAQEFGKLRLWPEDMPSGEEYDRIEDQLLFRPKNRPKRNKKIFLVTADRDWTLEPGNGEFRTCPVSTCEFVDERFWGKADLIFFKSSFLPKMHLKYTKNRPKDQIWSQFAIESPLNMEMEAPPSSVNWSITYRHDSEVPVPYYRFFPFKEQHVVPLTDHVVNKTKKVAWIVSNCEANNRRLEFARELQKHISVDIYGSCGPFKCGEECWEVLSRDYKFYLSFENSNCFEYISEKLWKNAFNNDVIPVVMGAHPNTYKRVAPPHSYIHVEDFPSAHALAEYLDLLDKDHVLYEKYFDWRVKGQVNHVFMWCRVCALLHAPKREHVYEDLNAWWKSGACVKDKWN